MSGRSWSERDELRGGAGGEREGYRTLEIISTPRL